MIVPILKLVHIKINQSTNNSINISNGQVDQDCDLVGYVLAGHGSFLLGCQINKNII